MSYAELQVTTHFSFLRGASSAQELFETAKALGIEVLGVVDRNSLAGIVRALEASRATGLRLVVGCRLDLADGMSVLVYPTDRAALFPADPPHHARQVARRQEQLYPALGRRHAHNDGMIGILYCRTYQLTLRDPAAPCAGVFGDRAYVSLCLRRRQNDQLRLHEISNLAARFKVRPVVTNDVLFHEPGRRQLQDIVTCIRTRTTIDEVGFERERHADRYLKPPEEMQRLFPRYRQALARTMEIVRRCTFSLEELTYQYPEEE
nr:PHP domain-containing protein [Agrobacterium tumefaciens]